MFAYDLAHAHGKEDVDAMLAAMTLPQFLEWVEYSRLHPFGEERADLRCGIVASTFANAFRGKNQRPFTPGDFMPSFDRPAKRKSRNQLWAAMKHMADTVNSFQRKGGNGQSGS